MGLVGEGGRGQKASSVTLGEVPMLHQAGRAQVWEVARVRGDAGGRATKTG